MRPKDYGSSAEKCCDRCWHSFWLASSDIRLCMAGDEPGGKLGLDDLPALNSFIIKRMVNKHGVCSQFRTSSS